MHSEMKAVAELRELWRLDPSTIYLNHGSFGPSPQPVRAARHLWTERLEQQPMRFFCREMEELLEDTAGVLAQFLNTSPERILLVDNATLAMNLVAASVTLKPGDEVLMTDHEYGAVRNIWSSRCHSTGARLVTAQLPLPVDSGRVVAAIAEKITPRTRLLVVSHVTSATACILPVKEICWLASQQRIPVCVDGPHAIAMLDLNLDDLGCDYYCASCHKWLCAPFGSGFLWVHPRFHQQVTCPVVSWGGSIAGRSASWKDSTNWLGTRDPAALLAISAAVEFFSPSRLALFRSHAHRLVSHARRELLKVPGTGIWSTASETDFVSMCGVELPRPSDWKPGYHGQPDALQRELRDRHGIEIPVASWSGRRFLRLSAHLYNTDEEISRFLAAIRSAESLC